MYIVHSWLNYYLWDNTLRLKPKEILFIHPPVVRPCEPPPGIAKLAGVLKRYGVEYDIMDANLEGLLFLLRRPMIARDTWTRRAIARVERNLEVLMQPAGYRNLDRYKQAVYELNRVLRMQDRSGGTEVSLANFQDRNLSPVKSGDLIRAFEFPAKNPFYIYFESRLGEVMENDRPRWVGLSLNFLSQALCTFAMIGVLRRLDPNIRIILGGGLVTSWLRRPGWRNPFEGIIDELVAGEGEAALLSVLDRETATGSDIADFNHFSPLPYLSPGLILPYSASVGCYWRRCAFCPERAEANPYRPIPFARVVSQLQSQIQILKPVLVHFTDNALSPALLKTLCREPCGVPWYGFVRITRHLADLDFCKALKRSGCIMLQIGLESGSQTVLDGFCKGIDLNVAQRALENLKHAGIAAYVYLLFGTPWETEADALKTLEFTIRNSGTITFLNLAIFNLPAFGPHTDALNTRPLDTGDMFLYRRFEHPAGWHRQRIRRFLENKFKRHPAIAPIIRADPPVFTSNHAPFIAPFLL
jgi:hypothetical protein